MLAARSQPIRLNCGLIVWVLLLAALAFAVVGLSDAAPDVNVV